MGPQYDGFKYKGVIGLDLSDKLFQLKNRILGVQVAISINFRAATLSRFSICARKCSVLNTKMRTQNFRI